MLKGLFYPALFIGALLVTPVHADVLLIDAISEEPVNAADGVPRPKRGMTMDQVRSHFGEPVKAHPWVGDPPITRWDYAGYSVFFEHEYVLNTVVYR